MRVSVCIMPLSLQVFGFLIQFVWAVNIWWLIIDTSWYINWKARRAQLTY